MRPRYLLSTLAALAVVPLFSQVAAQEKPAPAHISHAQQEEREQLLTLFALTASPLLPPVIAQDQSPAKTTSATPASQQHENEGERIFEQNCNRCHNAPEGFSPRISGTIVRHMRVRASLSKHDEEELLRFFNP